MIVLLKYQVSNLGLDSALSFVLEVGEDTTSFALCLICVGVKLVLVPMTC